MKERIELMKLSTSANTLWKFARIAGMCIMIGLVMNEGYGHDVGMVSLISFVLYIMFIFVLNGSMERNELLSYLEQAEAELAEIERLRSDNTTLIRERDRYEADALLFNEKNKVLEAERKVLLDRSNAVDSLLAENEQLKKRVAGLQSAVSRLSNKEKEEVLWKTKATYTISWGYQVN